MHPASPNFSPQQDFLAPLVEETSLQYAGFWLRFAALIIDGFILGLASWSIGAVENLPSYSFFEWNEYFNYSFGIDTETIISFFYYTVLESSNWQATLGKKVLGLKVSTLNGSRITYWRAVGRHFAQLLSVITFCIGYMMAGWTEKKQGLHDMIAGTLVVQA